MRSDRFPRFIAALVVIGSGLAGHTARGGDRLDNGLTVGVVPVPNEPEVMVILGVRAGIVEEPPGRPHLAHVAEHAVVFGLKPGSDEAKAVDGWFREGRANGETLFGFLYFDLRVPKEQLDDALRVQAARLAGPEIRQALLDREVPRTLQEVDLQERVAQVGTGKVAFSAFVQGALHGQADAPLRAATKSTRPEDVLAFHRRTFRPDRAALVILGDVDPADTRRRVAAAFGAIPKPGESSPAPALKAGPRDLTTRWDLKTRHLLAAWPIPGPADADHPALAVAAQDLEQRLFVNPGLRRLTTSRQVTADVPGLFVVNVQVKPEADLDAVWAELREQVGAIGAEARRTGLLRKTLSNALEPSLGPGVLGLLGGASRLLPRSNLELQRLGKGLHWGDPAPYRQRLDALDDKAVPAAARRHLDPAKAVLVRVMPME